jgi:hypothetical protein
MADQIVSWGGFNSKGTSGLGVTGSFSVSGSSNFSPNIAITGSATIDGIGSSEGFLEINSSQNDQNSALYFYENPNGLARNFASIIRYVGNGNTLRYLTKSGTETEYLRQSAGNSTFKQSVYVGDLQLLGSSGDSPFDVYATPAGNGMVGTLRRSGTGDVMMGFHQWGGTAYAIGAISGNNGFGFFNGRYSAAAGTEVARFSGNNNLLIGTTTDSARLTVKGSGTTSSTTALLVQNANASSSFSIKDNGDSTFFYPGIAGYSLKISGSYSGNGASAIYETLGASGGYYGIHEFRIGTGTANAVRAMSIVYGGRVVIGNKSNTVLQSPGANLLIDTNVINTFSSQSFNTGIIINPSGTLDTRFTASGIQFNFAANNPNDTNGGVFVGSQYNPATNGYDSDLVIFNSQGSAGSYVETARFVGKSKSLSLGAGRNPSASLHISGSSGSALLEIDSPAVNNILYVSGSGNVGIGTGTPGSRLSVAGNIDLGSNFIGNIVSNQYIHFTGGSGEYRFVNGGGGGWYYTWCQNSGNATPPREVMRLSTGDNLLIGTTSDSARLTVKGSGTTASTTSLLVQNANASASLLVLDNGTVGINTGSVSYNLDVNGSAAVKMPSYNSTGFVIRNADGNVDWQFYNNGNNSTNGRIMLQVPRWTSGTPIQISNSNSISQVNSAIMIGGGVSNGDKLNNKSIRVGANSNHLIGTGSIVIGTGNAQGDYSISISSEQYGIPVASVPNDSSFAIGSSIEGASSANNQGILSATSIFIGRPPRSSSFTGNTSNGTATTLAGMGGYGVTDATGGSLTIGGGQGLGAGTPGDLIFSTATTGSTGVIIQSLTERARFKANSGFFGIGTSTPSSSLHISGASAVLTLSPQDPLPSGVPTGSFAVSSSAPPKPYFYDGTTWNALY